MLLGLLSSYTGEYTRINGEEIHAASIHDLIKNKNKNLSAEIKNKFFHTIKDFYALAERAEHLEFYDQMISANNPEGNKIVLNLIDDLITQTNSLKKLRIALDLKEINEL